MALDPWRVLGVESGSLDEARRRYRHLAKLFHPDRNDSEVASETMRILNLAWAAVSAGAPPPIESEPEAPPDYSAFGPRAVPKLGKVHSKDFVGDPCEWVWPFGKHKGRTLGWICENDVPYLSWAQGNFNPDTHSHVLDILEGAIAHWLGAVHAEEARQARAYAAGR